MISAGGSALPCATPSSEPMPSCAHAILIEHFAFEAGLRRPSRARGPPGPAASADWRAHSTRSRVKFCAFGENPSALEGAIDLRAVGGGDGMESFERLCPGWRSCADRARNCREWRLRRRPRRRRRSSHQASVLTPFCLSERTVDAARLCEERPNRMLRVCRRRPRPDASRECLAADAARPARRPCP